MISFTLFPASHVDAEEELKHTGKLRFKQERIGGNERKSEEESSVNVETELEKTVPELFDESTREALDTKQMEQNKEQNELEEQLFLLPNEENVVIKETEASLFASDYVAPKVASEEPESNDNGLTNTPILAGLIGVALTICGGLYAFMRRVFE